MYSLNAIMTQSACVQSEMKLTVVNKSNNSREKAISCIVGMTRKTQIVVVIKQDSLDYSRKQRCEETNESMEDLKESIKMMRAELGIIQEQVGKL